MPPSTRIIRYETRGPVTTGLDIYFGPTRTTLALKSVEGALARRAFPSRIGPRILIEFEGDPIPAGQSLLIALEIDGEGLGEPTIDELGFAPADWSATADEPPQAWKDLYDIRAQETDPEQRFFFELDRRTLPALRFFALDLEPVNVNAVSSPIRSTLYDRIELRWYSEAPALPPLADPAPLNTWFQDSLTGSTLAKAALPRAFERFGAGLLRLPIKVRKEDPDVAADANSWNVFFFAEVAFALYEQHVDDDLWNPLLLRSALAMQTLFLARHETLTYVNSYGIPYADPVPARLREWIARYYDGIGLDDKALAIQFHRNLRLAGPAGMK